MVELNPRIYALGFLFIIVFGVVYGTPYLFPHPKPIENITPNITIIYKTIIQTVTPTPDGHIYFASEYQNGTRLLQRPFSWIRYNALGTMDMKVTTIVYDYKFFEKMHWFNPATYKYQEVLPEDSENNQFCLIFIYVFMDDQIADDTRMWAFNRSFFAIYNGNETYRPNEYPYQLRFKELENTKTFNGEYKVQAFKSFREYSSSKDYTSSAGEYNDEIYYLRGGVSNAIDGYLIFEIPKTNTPEDLLVLAQFYAFGSSQWRLRT
jgi:hypothetical protein